MQLIVGVAGLVAEVRQLKSQPYSKDDQHHEALLSEVSVEACICNGIPFCKKLGW